jgi:hypothetical protein
LKSFVPFIQKAINGELDGTGDYGFDPLSASSLINKGLDDLPSSFLNEGLTGHVNSSTCQFKHRRV